MAHAKAGTPVRYIRVMPPSRRTLKRQLANTHPRETEMRQERTRAAIRKRHGWKRRVRYSPERLAVRASRRERRKARRAISEGRAA